MSKNKLGEILRKERELRKASLRDVEAETGISNAYLSQIESGRIEEPSPNRLHALAKYFGLDYSFLMEAAGYAVPKTNTKGPSTSQTLLLRGKALTPEEEQVLADYLDFYRNHQARSAGKKK